MAPSTLQHRRSMISARLTDIRVELVGTLEKKRDYLVVVSIDDQEVVKTERKYGVAPLRWQEDHRLEFRPSSTIKVVLLRHSIFPLRRPYEIGQYSCNVIRLIENNTATTIDLTDDIGHMTLAGLSFQLSLIPDPAEDIMRRVDADLGRLKDNGVLTSASGHIDNAVSITQPGGDAENLLGSCVESLGQALQIFVKVMDGLADAHPIVKVSWTVLSAVYKTVQAQMLQDTVVLSLAESLREMVGAAQQVPDLLVVKGTTDVIEEVSRSSLEIASLIDEYTRPSFMGRMTRFQLTYEMKTRIKDCQTKCRELMDKFRLRLEIETNQEVKEQHSVVLDVQERLETIENQGLAKEIFRWLNAPDSSMNYNDACKKHLVDTGTWFIDGKAFSEWKNSNKFLCIYGKVGCGKTVLCSSIISHVANICRKQKSSAFAYFFFDGRDAQSTLQRHDGFIRSLIQQFVDQFDGIPSTLVQLHGRGHQQPSTDALEDTLRHILRGFTNAYIIIDSIDECAERRELLTWIKTTSLSKTGNLSLLGTSRPEEDIKANLQPLDPATITMEDGMVNSDMKTYIDSEMNEGRLCAWPEEVRLRVKDTLLTKAQGMFRWLAMQLEELQKCYDVAELDDQLDRLPQDLDETYSRVLARIPEQRRTRAKIFLQWTAFSAHPLSLEVLGEAASVEFDQDDFPNYNARRRYQPQDVLAACASLIIESDGYVKLAHFSVKEYLISERIMRGAAKDVSTSERLSHSLIAATCLAYLLQLASPGPLEDATLAAAPLATYAANHWVFHVRSGGGDGEHPIQKLVVALLESGNQLVNWIRLWDPENLRRGMQQRILSTEVAEPLYYASLLGFAAVSQWLLDSGTSINPSRTGGHRASEKSSYMQYGNALQAASHEGHLEMVKLLLEKDANVNMPGGKYGCALQAAAWICDEAVVKLLLKRGADVNMPGGEFGCALQAAACSGDEAIVRLLLESGADVDMQGGKYGTALQAAMLNEHKEIKNLLMEKGAARSDVAAFVEAVDVGDQETVKSFLEKGMDVNMNIGPGGCLLHAACAEGHTEVVRLFLANHVDINRQAGLYGSPLQAASRGGHFDIVKLLLENNVDISAQGGMYGNALMAASIEGEDDIVKLLLENGADVNARTTVQFRLGGDGDLVAVLRRFHEQEADMDVEGEFSYPLHEASYQGYANIVKILLAHGADVNAQGGHHENALWAALHGKEDDVAKLLLEHGAAPLSGLQQKID